MNYPTMTGEFSSPSDLRIKVTRAEEGPCLGDTSVHITDLPEAFYKLPKSMSCISAERFVWM